MSFFGSSKKSAPAFKKIRPVVVRTENVAKELLNLAQTNDVNASTLDIDILEVETFIRTDKEKEKETESDWEEVSSDELHKLDIATTLLNKNFHIKQVYEVEIFSKEDNNLFKNFHSAVGANASKCKIYLSIKAGSEIVYTPKLEEEFLKFINKSKVRAGILINIFDEMVPEYVSKIVSVAKVRGNIYFDKNETVLIAESQEPVHTVNDELIMHYDNKKNISESEKVDYANRGFIHSALQGDIIIEYIKPKKGTSGRNCRGEYIEPPEPTVTHEPKFTVDGTIEVVDKSGSIEYHAKENGYVSINDSVYTIKSNMDIDRIDFKTTGSISSGVDSDVSLSVKENDSQKDAIGNGMVVEVSEIDIKGNVGSHAKVIAKRITIDGQTHQTSEVNANSLTINVHKGLAIGDEITISRLEQGVVRGKTVNITHAIGGEISAKDIVIGSCTSHLRATASRLIDIHKLQGSENIFIIDPLMQQDAKEGLNENKSDISELQESVSEMQKEIDKYKKLVADNQESFNDVKKRLINYKKNGIKMPELFVAKYKQFNMAQEHLEKITEEHKIKKDKLLLLTTKTSSFQDNIFDARIVNRDKWIGHNELIFKLVNPPVELSFKPPEGSEAKVFAIVETEEGIYEIQAVAE